MALNEKFNLSNNELIDNDFELLILKNAIFRNKRKIFYFTLAGMFSAFLFGLQNIPN